MPTQKKMRAGVRRYVTLQQAAEEFSVSEASLRGLVKDGRLHAYRPLKGGWKILLKLSELEALVEGSVVAAATGKGA